MMQCSKPLTVTFPSVWSSSLCDGGYVSGGSQSCISSLTTSPLGAEAKCYKEASASTVTSTVSAPACFSTQPYHYQSCNPVTNESYNSNSIDQRVSDVTDSELLIESNSYSAATAADYVNLHGAILNISNIMVSIHSHSRLSSHSNVA